MNALRNGLAALLLCSGARAAEWKDLRAPSRADVRSLAGSGEALFAGTKDGNVFLSRNGGSDWDKAKLPKGFPVVSLAAYGDTVFAVRSAFYYPLADCFSWDCLPRASRDVAESRNGGRDWTSSGFHGATALAMETDGALWAFSRDSVFRRERGGAALLGRPIGFSPDGGPAITQRSRNCASAAVLSGSLFALIDDSLYRAPAVLTGADTLRFTRLAGPVFGMYPDSGRVLVSTGSGLQAWAAGPTPLALAAQPLLGWLGRGESGLLALARDSLTLYRSLDRGRSWARVAPALPGKAHAVAEAGNDLAVVLGDGTVWLSARGGAWRLPETGLAETPVLPFLVSGGKVWAQIHDRGIAYAPLGGGEWLRDTLPIGKDASPPLMAIAPASRWVGSAAGLWARKDGASAWDSVLGDEVTALAVSGNRIVASVERGPLTAAEHFLEFCDGSGPCRETPAGLFGKTHAYYSPFSGQKLASGRMDFLLALGDTVLAADSLCYRSLDGGNTWDTVPEAAGKVPAATLAWAGGSLYRLARGAAGCDPCLERSRDLGSTWEKLPFAAPERTYASARLAADGTNLFLLTDRGLLYSGDGSLWSEIWKGGGLPVSLAAGGGFIAVSDDANKLWSLALPPAPVGLRPPPAPAGKRKGPLPRFRDGLGRPRLANGAAPR